MSNIEHIRENVQKRRRLPDRRVHRTALAIQWALIDLIKEHGYDSIDVKDIAERANIGRSTFYSHFKHKEDVLLRSIDGLYQHMRDAWKVELEMTGAEYGQAKFVLPFLTHFGSNVDLWRAFATGEASDILLRKLRAIFLDLFREDQGVDVMSPPEAQANVQVHVGALMALVVWWLDLGVSMSPESVHYAFSKALGYK